MDDSTAGELARLIWTRAEPVHAVTYFSPECLDAYVEAGLRGFWRGYFAGRASPLGAVGAGPVIAAFHGFRPDFVERALPSIWELLPPEEAVAARLTGVDRALRRLLDVDADAAALTEAAELLRRATATASPAGRPVFAANAALTWPVDPHVAVWHGITLLREHRGDGHVAALTVAGLDGPAAHLLRLGVAGLPLDTMRTTRGWDDDDWGAARDRMIEDGLLGADGTATAAGRSVHAELEATTDRLASGPIRALGADGAERLGELLAPWADAIGTAGDVPYPNPMGVPRPR